MLSVRGMPRAHLRRRLFGAALYAGASRWVSRRRAAAQDFDLVIANGRVVDPESGLERVRSVGIRGGKIAAIAGTPLAGKGSSTRLASCRSGVHRPPRARADRGDYRLQALDGVTTSFELEVGTGDVDRWYREREKGRPSTTA